MTELLKIRARVLMNIPIEELWDNLEGDFIIVFDDGEEVLTHEKDLLYSHYIWQFHRQYNKTPLLKKHYVSEVAKKKPIGASTHLNMINGVLWDVYDLYVTEPPYNKDKQMLTDELAKLAYEISNVMYNDLSYRCEEYVTSLDITDFIKITQHPLVTEARSKLKPTQESIGEFNKTLLGLLKDPVVFADNPLAASIRAGLAREGQALQCIGVRGFVTDLDGHPFEKPVMRSFIQGIITLHDSMVESRSASIHLANSTAPLEQSEYFSRRQQLICMNVQHIHREDCGSTKWLPWHVRETDMPNIIGKYYLNELTGKLEVIKENQNELIGRTLRLRSPVAGCAHPDPYGVCEVCFGQLADNIPANTNLGEASCVSMTAILGQGILSTKHHIGSATVQSIVLGNIEKRYLGIYVNGKKNAYTLNPALANKRPLMLLPKSGVPGITDLYLVDNVEDLNPLRLSELEVIGIQTTVNDVEELSPSLRLEFNSRKASMTHAMLKYVKAMGWTINEREQYVIDLSKWDYSQPAFVLPMREHSTSDHQGEIATLLEATVKDMEERSERVLPANLLIELYDLVNSRMNVHLSIIEVILYSSMAVSPVRGDYSLPKSYTTAGVGVKQGLLKNRSVSATMAYQGHREAIISPANYISENQNRMDHPIDGVIMPAQVFNKVWT